MYKIITQNRKILTKLKHVLASVRTLGGLAYFLEMYNLYISWKRALNHALQMF